MNRLYATQLALAERLAATLNGLFCARQLMSLECSNSAPNGGYVSIPRVLPRR